MFSAGISAGSIIYKRLLQSSVHYNRWEFASLHFDSEGLFKELPAEIIITSIPNAEMV
jgi:hypothetical protein